MSDEIKICISCGDQFYPYHCCGGPRKEEDRCQECHTEVEHKSIRFGSADTGVNGGYSGYPRADREYHGGFHE